MVDSGLLPFVYMMQIMANTASEDFRRAMSWRLLVTQTFAPALRSSGGPSKQVNNEENQGGGGGRGGGCVLYDV